MMTQLNHVVRVHPIQNGLPNLSMVEYEEGFETKHDAECWISYYNRHLGNGIDLAVYHDVCQD